MKAFVCVIAAFLCLPVSTMHAQDIEAQLAGSTVSSGFTVFDNNNFNLFSVRGNRRVGIGTVTPAATLHISGSDGLLATGTRNSGNIPATGPGTRMMWYPKKAAFRVGNVGGSQWDDANIGGYSFAAGKETIASGEYSLALGLTTTASGDYSTALGAGTTASGLNSIAMGGFSTASGQVSFAFGEWSTASGDYSTVIGSRVSTNGMKGSFMIGDAYALATTSATHTHRFYARFQNGYVLYTRANRTTGVQALSGANSWSSVSDSTRKENFRDSQGEHTLKAFRSLRLGSWNYIGDDQRHYGPMAQEWFAAFGHDGIGTIGNDTTLATADVDGVLCIAVQALEKRTDNNRAQLASYEKQMLTLTAQLAGKDQVINQLREELATAQRENDVRYAQLMQLVRSLQKEQKIAQHLVR